MADISRGSMLPIAAAALASAAVIPAVAAQSSELAPLIEAHRAAFRAFEDWCGREDATKEDAPEYLAVKDAWDRRNEAELASHSDLRLRAPFAARGLRESRIPRAAPFATKGDEWDERHVEALLESIAGGRLYDKA